ncbi:BLUF domain-containing protein [Winogradskyella tangerina]|uniref:BLUF domain-containing protein n=1 Tax=Winogradskyella tangerina TaxID=2023240 RepID=UPI000DBE5CEF|nr:BLUF domain-containing protein [Winogradskyella tangerina]
MKAICYISNFAKGLNHSAISELIEFVNLNNTRHKITGLLILKNKHFFQILEGESQKIDALYEKIKEDKRHKGIIKLLDTNIEGQIFDNYNGGKFETFQKYADMKRLYLYFNWIKNANYLPADKLIHLTTNFLKHNK